MDPGAAEGDEPHGGALSVDGEGGTDVRPWKHARSSGGGVDGADHLPVHEFLDATKWACADRRHRAVLHHVDLGAGLARAAFPEVPDVDRIVRSHVEEDLRAPATLLDWFRLCDLARLPRPDPRRAGRGAAGIAEAVSTEFPPEHADAVRRTVDLLFRTYDHLPPAAAADPRPLSLLMNCVGPMIARRVFGPPDPDVPDPVDHAHVAEAAIYVAYGYIPDLGEVVRCWTGEPVGT